VRKHDGGNARRGILDDGEQQSIRGRRRSIADAEALEKRAVGEEAGDGAEKGLQRVIGLIGEIVGRDAVREADGKERFRQGLAPCCYRMCETSIVGAFVDGNLDDVPMTVSVGLACVMLEVTKVRQLR
jgi:hypothetical protein